MTPSRSEFLTVRGLRTHVRHWGRAGAPKIFMLHGWMDVGASFQFVVDHLRGDWHVIAPDWRGFGLTERPGTDTYWFPDYLADLDALLRHYQPEGQVNLLGHSMGGNIAGIYAGVRPERIRRFVNLEGFGLKGAVPDDAPKRYAKWLDELLEPPTMKAYPTRQDVAARLQKTNPRLTDERAAFLAEHWSARNAQGEWEILGDPVHKQASPLPYHAEDIMACWRRISAPVLWVEAEDTNMWLWLGGPEEGRREVDRRMANIADVTPKKLPDAGHMLHHDQPALLAEMIEAFLG
ncbi:pimeloyl-ACP methyl ester carboxylesterase [Pseudoduganella flava]|uniref:Alpha/beta fold hydrolase n=1 Tax=Pseudoduganella flava TaxID=871742 RepID=A0A562PT34_9BURK|nr:alpha/beta hydrolase [Pseudoduganella flava]QGZ39144.1 alpha/beta fold hydrolase [Pseudoduganella flava]TWI47569.1 pimeloyl-ACP methyl ester carboxylesterase [Pseudoduganella flava]